MLKNHSKPPGPWNRGDRSALVYDKRPIEVRILEKVLDKKPRKDEKHMKELKDLMATQSHEIDDIFYDRGMCMLFEQMTEETKKQKPSV